MICHFEFIQETTSGGAVACTECPAGTYASESGSTGCSNCPTGSTSPPRSVQHSDCKCDAGYAQDDAGCTCKAGFTMHAASATVYPSLTTSDVCIECEAGKFKASVGSGPCTDCEKGKSSREITRHIGRKIVFTNGPGSRVTQSNQAYCYFKAPGRGRLVSWSVNHRGETDRACDECCKRFSL
jgi:hypothetical protein